MARAQEPERHNINLSRRVWGELKLRSVQESASASELIAYVVEQCSRDDLSMGSIPRYQQRSPDEDRLGRTVFFPPETWKKAQALASQTGASVAGVIDYLLRKYLGIAVESEGADSASANGESAGAVSESGHIEYAPPGRGEVIRVGEERVYLGENPVKIDYKTGKTLRE